jgi:small nuclear ribonucleoprotein (snRNP)-like protein
MVLSQVELWQQASFRDRPVLIITKKQNTSRGYLHSVDSKNHACNGLLRSTSQILVDGERRKCNVSCVTGVGS